MPQAIWENSDTLELLAVLVNKREGKKNSAVAGYGHIREKGTPSSTHQVKEKMPVKKTTISIKIVKTLILEITLGDFFEENLIASKKGLLEDSAIPRVVEDVDPINVNANDVINLPVPTIPSRILRDVFHVLDLIKVKMHGMAKDF